MSDNGIERGAAEEASGTPLTQTEVDAEQRPASEPDPSRADDEEEAQNGS
jgi:hypothetical protein